MSYFFEIPDQESRYALRSALVSMLLIHSSRSALAVQQQLALALADYAVHDASWVGVVDDLLGIFLQQAPQPDGLRAVLLVLAVLPEETVNARLLQSESARADAEDRMLGHDATLAVLGLLCELAGQWRGTADAETLIFRCVDAWLSHADCDHAVLAEHEIVDVLFDALAMPDLFAKVLDPVRALVVRASMRASSDPVFASSEHSSGDNSEGESGPSSCDVLDAANGELVATLIPRVLELPDALAADEDSQHAIGYAHVLSDACTSFAPFLMEMHEDGVALLRCMGAMLASADWDVAAIAANFWWHFIDRMAATELDLSKAESYSGLFESVLDVLVRRYEEMLKEGAIPATGDEAGAEASDSMSAVRADAEQIVEAMCGVADGVRVLRLAYAVWQQAGTSSMSLLLLAGPAIALVRRDEAAVLPELFGSLDEASWRASEENLLASLRLTQCASRWLGANPSWLSAALACIVYGLTETAAGAPAQGLAAAALSAVSRDCAVHLVDHRSTVLALALAVLGQGEATFACKRCLANSLGFLVQLMPASADTIRFIGDVSAPFVSELGQALASHSFGAADEALRLLHAFLLASRSSRAESVAAFSAAGLTPPFLAVLRDCWDALCTALRCEVENVAAGATSVLSFAIKAAHVDALEVVEQLLPVLSSAMGGAVMFGCFAQLANVCGDVLVTALERGVQTDYCAGALVQMLHTFVAQPLDAMLTVEALGADPELSRQIFELVLMFLVNEPARTVLLSSEASLAVLVHATELAVVGVRVEHIDVRRACLNLFETLYSFVPSDADAELRERLADTVIEADQFHAIGAVLGAGGAAIVETLLAIEIENAGSGAPMLAEARDVLEAIMVLRPAELRAWFEAALGRIPDQYMRADERAALLDCAFDPPFGAAPPIDQIVHELAITCRSRGFLEPTPERERARP